MSDLKNEKKNGQVVDASYTVEPKISGTVAINRIMSVLEKVTDTEAQRVLQYVVDAYQEKRNQSYAASLKQAEFQGLQGRHQ